MSRSILTRLLIFSGLLASAWAVQAQESTVHWHVMGGYSDTLGTTSNYLQGGYIVGGGLSITPAWMHPLRNAPST